MVANTELKPLKKGADVTNLNQFEKLDKQQITPSRRPLIAEDKSKWFANPTNQFEEIKEEVEESSSAS